MRARKVCLHCGEEYERRVKESTPSWQGRKFCSADCSARNQAKLSDRFPMKECLTCGKMMVPTSRTDEASWVRRKFCSSACSARHIKQGDTWKYDPEADRVATDNLLRALLRYGLAHDSDLGMGRERFFDTAQRMGVTA